MSKHKEKNFIIGNNGIVGLVKQWLETEIKVIKLIVMLLC